MLIVSLHPSGPAHAGDQIVLQRAIEFLEARFDCAAVLFERGQPLRKIRDALLGAPSELSGYVGANERHTIRGAISKHRPQHVFILHEGLFPLRSEIEAVGIPCTFLAHNLLSRFSCRKTAFDSLNGWAARRFERRWYAPGPADRLVFLSQGDRRAAIDLLGCGYADRVTVALPGAPSQSPLSEAASFSTELVLTGSYAWWRKRRDLKVFAASAPPLPIHVFDASALRELPQGVLHHSKRDLDWQDQIRVGVVSDRFVGGFKLKALEYVALNCALYSFAPIAEEFDGLPFAELFVQTAETSEMQVFIASLQALTQKELQEKFAAFKLSCLMRFQWDLQLMALLPDGPTSFSRG